MEVVNWLAAILTQKRHHILNTADKLKYAVMTDSHVPNWKVCTPKKGAWMRMRPHVMMTETLHHMKCWSYAAVRLILATSWASNGNKQAGMG